MRPIRWLVDAAVVGAGLWVSPRLVHRGSRDAAGPLGERAASAHLHRRGYVVVRRNYRLPAGELDLLMMAPDRRTLVVVEVKSRRLRRAGATGRPPPEASVTDHKRRKLFILSRDAVRRLKHEGPVRIDVVAVEFVGRRWPTIRHYEDAVRGR